MRTASAQIYIFHSNSKTAVQAEDWLRLPALDLNAITLSLAGNGTPELFTRLHSLRHFLLFLAAATFVHRTPFDYG